MVQIDIVLFRAVATMAAQQLSLLAVAGQEVVSPGSVSDPAAVFKALGDKFMLDEKVVKFFVETEKLTSLKEFVAMATSEAELSDIIKAVPNLERVIQQTARLRLAWAAVKDASDKAVAVSKQDEQPEDLDKLLPQKELEDIDDLFWSKHHLTFEPDDTPSDGLVSRVAREIVKRLLTSRDVWATKTLTFQQRHERKTTRIADGIDLVHNEIAVEVHVIDNVMLEVGLHGDLVVDEVDALCDTCLLALVPLLESERLGGPDVT